MSDKVIRISEYTNLNADFIEKCREGILKLESFVDRYVKSQELDPLEQLVELEDIKRQHISFLTFFLRYLTPVTSYRENGEFMASERKSLKSHTIKELIKSGTNATTSDKILYDNESYKDHIKQIQEIKKFFVYVYETYDLHKNVISRSIHQSISTLQKELESLKRS